MESRIPIFFSFFSLTYARARIETTNIYRAYSLVPFLCVRAFVFFYLFSEVGDDDICLFSFRIRTISLFGGKTVELERGCFFSLSSKSVVLFFFFSNSVSFRVRVCRSLERKGIIPRGWRRRDVFVAEQT